MSENTRVNIKVNKINVRKLLIYGKITVSKFFAL